MPDSTRCSEMKLFEQACLALERGDPEAIHQLKLSLAVALAAGNHTLAEDVAHLLNQLGDHSPLVGNLDRSQKRSNGVGLDGELDSAAPPNGPA